MFQTEVQQLQSTINHLQKELSDRLILIASQNEKISQLEVEYGKTCNNKKNINDESNTNNEGKKFNINYNFIYFFSIFLK